MITRIATQDYSESQVLTVDADKETIAKILAFVADLNKEQQTKPNDVK
jgi:hypothetical protein